MIRDHLVHFLFDVIRINGSDLKQQHCGKFVKLAFIFFFQLHAARGVLAEVNR